MSPQIIVPDHSLQVTDAVQAQRNNVFPVPHNRRMSQPSGTAASSIKCEAQMAVSLVLQMAVSLVLQMAVSLVLQMAVSVVLQVTELRYNISNLSTTYSLPAYTRSSTPRTQKDSSGQAWTAGEPAVYAQLLRSHIAPCSSWADCPTLDGFMSVISRGKRVDRDLMPSFDEAPLPAPTYWSYLQWTNRITNQTITSGRVGTRSRSYSLLEQTSVSTSRKGDWTDQYGAPEVGVIWNIGDGWEGRYSASIHLDGIELHLSSALTPRIVFRALSVHR